MTDRIVLAGMIFQARHGVLDWEKTTAQRFEVDVELVLDVQPAGLDDDLTRTVDYRNVYRVVRQIVESTTYNLVEALAEAIAHEILAEQALVDEVVIRVRKPEVRLDGPLDYTGVEIRRLRTR
ncbi:MAG: 7,8-dihydroneopterin aldolase/epimerase/oxygenase [Chloroflexota bacterium]|jgi:dihydroneopterin aldolase|nr:7,8-dihydroneopterin aldolase/epimerase/oxygenase [Chloroflexota bacterium]